MKALKTFIVTVLVLNLLVIAGLFGYLLATGRLDGAKAGAIVDLLRHPGTPQHLRENVGDLMQPTTAPATAPADLAAASATQAAPPEMASASDRIAYAQRAIEQERLQLDRDAQDLQNRQKLLEGQSKEVDARLAEVVAQRKKFEAEVAAHAAQTHDKSFDRMLELYGELKPQQVKDFFMAMDPDLVASYLRAMDTDQSSRIIAQFQTEDEKTFILSVLSKLRTSGTTSALADSATQPNSPARAGQARN